MIGNRKQVKSKIAYGNSFQLTTTEHMFTWNLDKNHEVNTLFHYNGLTSVS
jgi:hypothetical protein